MGVTSGISYEIRAILVDLEYDLNPDPRDRLFKSLPYLNAADREEMKRGFDALVERQVVRSRAAA